MKFPRGRDSAYVLPVEIHATHLKVNGEILSQNDAWTFAQKDGFVLLSHFYDFFVDKYGVTKDKPLIDMEVIKWDYPMDTLTK